MLKQFELNIHKNTLFTKNDKLLVAFSGGIDSVVLTDLLYKTGYNIELAHCNFQLRGDEANADTEFCEKFAKSKNIPFHVIYFNTKQYASIHKQSIQMAARHLRYDWFKKLKNEFGFDFILTAHHANDNIETLLVNLTRGTGINGLRGIPLKQNNIIRPLLFATKEEIKQYAIYNQLSYREDSSNQEIKYKRNFIRHNIISELKKLNPALEETMNRSLHFFNQASDIVKDFAASKYQLICTEQNNLLYINIKFLLKEQQIETLLFEWLYPKSFKTNQIQQLSEALVLANKTGKQFSTTTHKLVIDREYIIVKDLKTTIETCEHTINTIDDTKFLPINLSFKIITEANFTKNTNEIHIPYSDNLFPLKLRKWKHGDKFKPFGINGFKKLSDFFKDKKLSLFEKENVWILEHKNNIIWVVGYRMDDRYKITDSDKNILHITVNN